MLVIAFSIHGYVPYTLSYQLLMPPFRCRPAGDPTAAFYNCEHSDFYAHGHCNPAIEFEPNMDTPYSLYNWTYELELYCTSSFLIGLFGSLYFAGFMLGSLTLLRLGDIYGRRPVYLLGLALHLISMVLVMAISSQTARYVSISMIGFATSITVNLTFVLLLELAPAKDSGLLGGFPHALDGSNILFCTFYLTQISRHWEGYQYWGIGLSVLVTLLTLRVPESPHFLLTMGRFGEAREVFKRIATTNGVELEHFRFEAEVIDKKDNGELMTRLQ